MAQFDAVKEFARYQETLAFYRKIKGWIDEDGLRKDEQDFTTYSDFDAFESGLLRALEDLRYRLIERSWRRLHGIVMPNVKVEWEFDTMMNEWTGDKLGLDYAKLENWFHDMLVAGDKLRDLSFSSILASARDLLPYKGIAEVKGKVMKLRCYSWVPSSFGGYISIHDDEPLSSFEKLVDVILLGADPVKVKGSMGLFEHVRNRHNPEDFYAQGVSWRNTKVDGFRFYKNENLDIKFKSPVDAVKVAEVLNKPLKD